MTELSLCTLHLGEVDVEGANEAIFDLLFESFDILGTGAAQIDDRTPNVCSEDVAVDVSHQRLVGVGGQNDSHSRTSGGGNQRQGESACYRGLLEASSRPGSAEGSDMQQRACALNGESAWKIVVSPFEGKRPPVLLRQQSRRTILREC